MTTPDPVREASRRVRKYLTELGKVRGLHQEDITTLHSGDENREAALTASDLRLLCDNADAQAALSAPPPQGWKFERIYGPADLEGYLVTAPDGTSAAAWATDRNPKNLIFKFAKTFAASPRNETNILP